MGFPAYRPRRMRANPAVRAFVRETRVEPGDLVYPVFVKPGAGVRDEVASMPGVFQLSIDQLAAEVDELRSCRVNSLMLFGLPARKDERGSEAYDDRGVVQQAVRAIKEHAPDFHVITDVCLCEYTSHGHCGVLDERGGVDNDETLGLLAAEAVSYYGPFRDAADSAPAFGDRSAYQMDPANSVEALREVRLDIEEGADLVIVKPALSYLDVVRRVKDAFAFPTVAYNVSGEYAMVKAAAAQGWIDERRVVLETLLSMKRAGADAIITYHAKDAARWIIGGRHGR